MRFTVTYRKIALDELAKLWMSWPDRGVIAAASDTIDHELAVDPDRKGRPFGSTGARLFVAAPLAVLFTVSVDDRLVRIWQVGIYDPFG